jgi:P-type E1-E2 ATPase
MIVAEIPGFRTLALSYLVLDVNGTLTLDGELLEGVSERIDMLREKLKIILLTADTLGRAHEVAERLGVSCEKIPHLQEREAKERFVARLGAESVVAMGNGANDVGMLRSSGLGIAVLGPEGASSEAVAAADVVAPGICTALDLLIHPMRLIATLRR